MKYRSMLLNLEDEANTRIVQASGMATDVPDNKEESELYQKQNLELEAKMTEAQKQLAEIKIDRDLSRQDAVQMYEMMELLKAKYATLIEENRKQNEELINSEAEKLEVARALIDMKMELSSVMETAEKDKFELSAQVLSLKNQLLETEEREQMAEVTYPYALTIRNAINNEHVLRLLLATRKKNSRM